MTDTYSRANKTQLPEVLPLKQNAFGLTALKSSLNLGAPSLLFEDGRYVIYRQQASQTDIAINKKLPLYLEAFKNKLNGNYHQTTLNRPL